jgi:polypeptide N-acetylgalactosaminyltransferase
MAAEGLCLDTIGHPEDNKPIGLFSCATDRESPQDTQYFKLRYFRDIELTKMSLCFDSADKEIVSLPCHNGQGNQYFRYDPDTNQIYHRARRLQRCIDHDPNEAKVFIAICDEWSETQKWKWGSVNETLVRNWLSYGKEILDRKEIKDLRKLLE